MSRLCVFPNRIQLSMADCIDSCEVTPVTLSPSNHKTAEIHLVIYIDTCAWPLYTKCVNMDTLSKSNTPASKHAGRTVQQPLASFLLTVHLHPRCALDSEVLPSAGCFAFPLWNMWGVPVDRPSGCISLCVMGICLPQPLVGQLQGFG